MASKQSGNPNGAVKIIGFFIVIVVGLLGVYANNTISLQNAQFSKLDNEIESVEQIIDRLSEKHNGLASDLATIKERFREIETQREYYEFRLDEQNRRLIKLEDRTK